jgi:hypothetical protein
MSSSRPDPSPLMFRARRRPLAALPALGGVLLALTGCASLVNNDPTGYYVSATDTQNVVYAERTIQANCQPAGSQPASALSQAVNSLLGVYREAPNHSVKYGSEAVVRSMKTIVQQNAQLLDRCGAASEGASLLAGAKLSG